MPSAASYTNKIRFAASVKNTKAQLVGGVGNLTQGSIAGCGLDIQYTPVDYVKICECKVNPPFTGPPPIILDVSSWDYPGTLSFTTSDIASSTKIVNLSVTVNNDIINNDTTIAFIGNSVSSATVGAIELTVNDGIISVPSGTFGLTDNILNIVFQTITNAGSNLSMTINPVFQDVYSDILGVNYIINRVYFSVTGPQKPTNFIRFIANVDNLSTVDSLIYFKINGEYSLDNAIYATTYSGMILPVELNSNVGGTVLSGIICQRGILVEGINTIFMKFQDIVNTIGYVFVSSEL